MKPLLIIVFSMSFLFSKGQQLQTLDEITIRGYGRGLECSFVMSINNLDTTEYFLLSFVNMEYSLISDIQIISKNSQTELDSLISDAEKIQEWIINNKGIKASFRKGEFFIKNPGERNNVIMITNEKHGIIKGYTFLQPKKFPILIQFMKSRKLKK